MRLALVAALALVVAACSSSATDVTPTKPLAPGTPSAYTSVVYDLPLAIATEKVKGRYVVTLAWDHTLVSTPDVVIQRQNQSVQPVFTVFVAPNTGTFVDTLPKGKAGTGYYYDLCEYPYPDVVHCADTNGQNGVP